MLRPNKNIYAEVDGMELTLKVSILKSLYRIIRWKVSLLILIRCSSF